MLGIFNVGFLFLIFFLIIFIYHLNINNNFFLNNNNIWSSSFECGFLSQSFSLSNYSNTFLILLVFFVIFDIEISLLLNITFNYPLYNNLIFYWIFLFYISIGFLIEILNNFINWDY
uniref:NADH-ubiquinone oxidoreductase chain 3 n=1 Tax=Paratetraonchoides inermis TaxID=2048240 RepID=A0A2D1GRS6_9PLAT|nr:NADH dehydrogenase subunit 3 [Paratetraonchoides inermis]ATN95416.1 NADH dehydrogenase subunit 3 [Paratetraonchoides inermis]